MKEEEIEVHKILDENNIKRVNIKETFACRYSACKSPLIAKCVREQKLSCDQCEIKEASPFTINS